MNKKVFEMKWKIMDLIMEEMVKAKALKDFDRFWVLSDIWEKIYEKYKIK